MSKQIKENEEIVWSDLQFVQESAKKSNFSRPKYKVLKCFNRAKQKYFSVNLEDYVQEILVPQILK